MATNDESDDDDPELPDFMKDIHRPTATDEHRAEFMEFMRRCIEDVKAGRTRPAREFVESLGKDEGGAEEMKP